LRSAALLFLTIAVVTGEAIPETAAVAQGR